MGRGVIAAPEFMPSLDNALGEQRRGLARIVIGVQPLHEPAHMQPHLGPRGPRPNAEIAMEAGVGKEQHLLEIENRRGTEQFDRLSRRGNSSFRRLGASGGEANDIENVGRKRLLPHDAGQSRRSREIDGQIDGSPHSQGYSPVVDANFGLSAP